MKEVCIRLYSFDELDDEAKEFAIADHASFLDNEAIEYETESGMQYMYHEHADEEVIEHIRANEYLFFNNGRLAHCCTYIAGPNKGVTEFYFADETYVL